MNAREALSTPGATRREVLIGTAAALATTLPLGSLAATATSISTSASIVDGSETMSSIKTKDGAQIFYKDWGTGQPIVFHHGWPLSGDDWDNQMLYFIGKGFRVIAHDRRGHGRSSQTSGGNDMDTYAADVAALAEALDLRDAIHIGHSTGGGEVTRYVARHGKGRVAKAVLISAIPPVMVKSAKNPEDFPSRSSTATARLWQPIGRSSISTSRAVRSTASTAPARSSPKARSAIGGVRA